MRYIFSFFFLFHSVATGSLLVNNDIHCNPFLNAKATNKGE